MEINTEDDCEQFLEGFNLVWFTLFKYIDSENGLLECLVNKEILTITDYIVLNNMTPYKRRNREMILNYIRPKIVVICKQFVDALVEDQQEHIVAHIMSFGMNQGEDRLLTDEEIEIIDNNMFGLVKLIHPYKMEFLYRLVSKKCITSTHKETIESHNEFTKKVDELLTVLKRRRYRDLLSFKQCLHDTMQHKIVELFEKSGLVAIHVELVKRSDISFIESALIAHMTDYVEENNEKTLTAEQKRFVNHILKELEDANIRLLGTSSWHSMAVFFMCSSTNSFPVIHEKFESGRLKQILEKVYRVFYKLPNCAPDLIENISLHELPFRQFSSSPLSPVVEDETLRIISERKRKIQDCLREFEPLRKRTMENSRLTGIKIAEIAAEKKAAKKKALVFGGVGIGMAAVLTGGTALLAGSGAAAVAGGAGIIGTFLGTTLFLVSAVYVLQLVLGKDAGPDPGKTFQEHFDRDRSAYIQLYNLLASVVGLHSPILSPHEHAEVLHNIDKAKELLKKDKFSEEDGLQFTKISDKLDENFRQIVSLNKKLEAIE